MSLNSKLIALLGHNYRKPFYWFLFISVVFALLETAGLAFVLPYLEVVGRYASGGTQDQVQRLMHYWDISADGIELVYIASAVLFTLMFLKYALQIYVSYLSAALPYDLYQHHGSLLAKKYNRLEWVEFSLENSNEIIKNVTKANELLAYSYVVYLQYLTSIIVIFFLILILLIVNFTSALVLLAIFSAMGGATYFSMRKSQLDAGLEREKWLSAVFKRASELFLGKREIKITGTSQYFEHSFETALHSLASAFKKTTFYPRLPVVFIELGAVIILLAVVIVAAKFRYDLETLIGYLIFYAAVARRLLPTISMLISCKSTLKNLAPTIDNLFRELHREVDLSNEKAAMNVGHAANLTGWSKISLHDVSFSYDAKKEVLSNLNFVISRNQRIAFVGPSGAGKSTIVDILTGLLTPNSGALRIDNMETQDFTLLNPVIGYVPQMPFILDASIAENVAFGKVEIDHERLQVVLDLVDLVGFVQGLELGTNTIVGERGVKLSGGQRQRISIARALYGNPEIIVFDEATSALDTVSERIISNAINSLSNSKTVICVAHRLSTIKQFDVIYYVKDGTITHEGTHGELLRNCHDYKVMNEVVELL